MTSDGRHNRRRGGNGRGGALAAISMESPERFINREQSWLSFNTRVLEEAENPAHPLLERLRFLSISASNLDEFYMVRVAGLHEQVKANVQIRSQDGLTPLEQLERLQEEASALMVKQQKRWAALRGELAKAGISVLDAAELTASDLEILRPLFQERVYPLLTPLAIDPAHPFPFIPNLGFAMALKLKRKDDGRALNALVPLPTQVERFLELRANDRNVVASGPRRFIALEAALGLFLDQLFPGYDVVAKGCFRVVRDSDIENVEEAEDLVREFRTLLKQRRLGEIVRLKAEASMPADLRAFIVHEIEADPHDVVLADGMLGLSQLSTLIVDDRTDLKFEPYEPRFPERVRDFGGDIFAAIRAKD
ncbi:MAG: polyphosphate kinase, partial [Alphaproteobacteria bacterium]